MKPTNKLSTLRANGFSVLNCAKCHITHVRPFKTLKRVAELDSTGRYVLVIRMMQPGFTDVPVMISFMDEQE